MNNYNIAVLGYSKNYNKFLKHIKSKQTKYKLKILIDKSKNFNFKNFSKECLKKKIKFLALCDKFYLPSVVKNINFYLNKKITIVQASNNFETDTHGYLIEKPFYDYSFEDIFLRKTLNFKNLDTKLFKNKKILVTGGAGSIGGGLVLKLLKINVSKIIVLDNNEHNIFKLKNKIDFQDNEKKIEYKTLNIENQKLINFFFQETKPDIVFHAAALKHVVFLENNIKQGFFTNVKGTKNILDAARKNKTKYFIHISTDKAADPKNNLGLTKLLSEFVCNDLKDKNMKIGVVRFGNVFNSYGSVAETFREKMFRAKKIQLSHPNVERYFMSLDEASNLILSTLTYISKKNNDKFCRTFICDMGTPIKIKDLAIKMLYLSGRDPKKYLSKKYYGLKNIEKISEKLISNKEKFLNKLSERVYEIECNYKKINVNNLYKKIENLDENKSKNILKKILI